MADPGLSGVITRSQLEQILSSGFEGPHVLTEGLLARIPKDEDKNEFILLLCEYYQLIGREREFIQWAIRKSLPKIVRPADIWSEPSLKPILQYFWIAPVGIKYMNVCFEPFLKSAGNQKLSLVDHLSQVLDSIESSASKCPLQLRELTYQVTSISKAYWAKQKVHLGREFRASFFADVMFQCFESTFLHVLGLHNDESPTLTPRSTSMSSGSEEDVTVLSRRDGSAQLKALIGALTSIARQDQYMTSSFLSSAALTQHSEALTKRYFDQLIDEAELQFSRQVIRGSLVVRNLAEKQKKLLNQILEYFSNTESRQVYLTDRVRHQQIAATLSDVRKGTDQNWVLKKVAAGTELYLPAKKDDNHFRVKLVGDLPGSIERCYKLFHGKSKNFRKFLSYTLPQCYGLQVTPETDNSQTWYMQIKAPFPLQDRDLVVKVFDELDLIKGQAVLIRFSPGDGDELVEVDKKKFKRAFLVSSILFLERLSEQKVKATMVIDADVRGQIPKGVRRYFMLTEMVEYFELVGKWLDAELKYHTSVRQLAQIHNAEKEKDNKEERKGNGSRIGRSGTRSGSGSGFTLAAPPEEEPTLCPICSDEPVVIQCSECDQVFCGKCDSVAHRYQEEHQRQRLTRRKMRSNVSASSSYSSEEPSDPGLVRRSGSASMLSSFDAPKTRARAKSTESPDPKHNRSPSNSPSKKTRGVSSSEDSGSKIRTRKIKEQD